MEHGEVLADCMGTQKAHSSPPTPECVHEVFLSFRGEDTRDGFTKYLYTALKRKGINTFRDDDKLERGKTIKPELLKAIEESKLAVVILSDDFASSTWCLDELAHIVKCNEDKGLQIFPVFYYVDPSEVRKQRTGNFGKALAKHEEDFKNEIGKVERWREALKHVSNISGWHIQKERSYESEIIQDIAQKILDLLKPLRANRDLIGIDSRLKKVMQLCFDPAPLSNDDVRTIGIWGVGGIGKTILARQAFEKIVLERSEEFKHICFLDRVREECGKHGRGLVYLQNYLFKTLPDSNKDDRIQDIPKGKELLSARLRFHKVLIVLDDVDDFEQIKALADCSWLSPGSRVIVTTRDKTTLKKCQVNDDKIYEVEKLTPGEAFQLFCRKAFKKSHAPDDHYKDLSDKFVEYASGLPLALQVLGSYLNEEKDWAEVLDKLKEYPEKGIDGVLEISCRGLEHTQREIFLDIACFFNGEDEVRVKKILESCGFYPNNGILDLVDKSLITIEHNKLWMHDLLQQTGQQIAVKEFPKEPGKRSRLWVNNKAYKDKESWHNEVLTENTGTNLVEGMFLCLPETRQIKLDADPFSKMYNLRLLKICNANFSKCPEYFSKKLRLLEWHEYPLECLPSSFGPHQLVELKMPNSRIKQLWNERLPLMENLVQIDLSNSQSLTKTLDFHMVPNLEELILEGCVKLLELHPTIGNLQHLRLLNLKGCESLESLPPISLGSLKTLILSGCSKLTKFPEIVGSMEKLSRLYLDGTAIRELPVTFEKLRGLILLNLKGCKNLHLSRSSILGSLTSLKDLNLSGCSHVELPENIGNLQHLEELDACDSGIRKVPSSISCLNKLKLLCLNRCKDEQMGLQLPNSFSGLTSLYRLNLSQCGLEERAFPDDIDCLSSLLYLDLSENNFVSLPAGISQLPELKQLSLFRCRNLELLPKTLPSKLTHVSARECPMLKNYSSNLTIRADGGFCHIDCGNPSENEENEDYNHFPLPIPEDHAETHLPKYIEERIKSEESFELRFPHSAIIPDWCSEHSSRDSVTIQLSDSTWIGFALFVVFELLVKEDFDNSWEMKDTFCHFSTSENPLVLHKFNNFRKGSYGLCCYQPRGRQFARQLSTESRLLKASVSTNRPDLKVKGCALQLIYQKDAAAFVRDLSESANGHLNLNFGRHCKGILDRARELNSSGEVTVISSNLQELGSTSTSNQGSSSQSTTYSNIEQSNGELQLLLSALYEGCNGREKNFHFIFSHPIISRWFIHHYAGGVALCHLPQHLYDDRRWVGFELYVVLTWSSSDYNNPPHSAWLHVDLCSPEGRIMHRCIKIHNLGQKQLVVLHIPRVCFSQHELDQCQVVCALFETSTQDVEVEVCGSRLAYEQDLKELIKALATECTFKGPLDLLYVQARTYVENMVESPLREALTVQCEALVPQFREIWEVSKLFWQDLLLNSGPEEQVHEQDFTSRLHYYMCYLEQKQVLVEPLDHLLVHSKRYLLENRDSIQQHDAERYSESLDRRLYIMAENQLYGSCNIAAWKKSIVVLLQIWEEAILSLKGHTISVLKLFNPSAPYNFFFPQKQILEWFKIQTSKSSEIGMELPQNLYDDDNWRGLVICAAFSVHELPTATLEKLGSEMTVELMCHLSTEEYCLNPIPICSTTKEKFKWLHLRGFIWLTYIPRNFLAEFKDITLVLARIYHGCPGLTVEDTGIRLLYKHEVEELKQAMTQCWTSFFDNSDLIHQFVEEDEIMQSSDCISVSYESEIIQDTAQKILDPLKPLRANKDLIGVDSRLKKVMQLCFDPAPLSNDDVRTIGIWGVGGIGKTTLARQAFEKIVLERNEEFKHRCFLDRVREECGKHGRGLVYLQNYLYKTLPDSNQDDHIQDISKGKKLLSARLRFHKVLIVLDDVDDFEQIKALADCSWLGPGSRVIVTIRDKTTLKKCQVNDDKIYEVEKLTPGEAFQLFCRKAFKKSHAPDDHYKDLSDKFIEYASGLPLALQVLGSYLNEEKDWAEVLDKLKEYPEKGIDGVLEISCRGLENTQREIFLDIACFFNGEDEVRVKKILESCGFYPNNGILDLVDKSLITIEHNKLWMHDLLLQTGRQLVVKEFPNEPGKHSRLWVANRAYKDRESWHNEVLTENTGTNLVEGMFLCLPETRQIKLDADPFSKMYNLRLLKICNANFSECPEYFSKKLRLLEWHEYPLECLPSSFGPHQLVELKMPNSRIKQLWNERLPLMENLVKIDLSNSQSLTKTLDFSMVPNLEELVLEGCVKLLELHPTIGSLQHLRSLNLKGCESLESLPSISFGSLRTLILSGCSKLTEFPEIMGSMEKLSRIYLDGTAAIRELPVTFEKLRGLVLLNLKGCKNLHLSRSSILGSLTSLKDLNLSGCSHVELPENIGNLQNLEELDACDSGIRKVPSSISRLNKLKLLCLNRCKDEQMGLQLPNSFSGLTSLYRLNLGQCGLEEGAIPDDIDCLTSLLYLDLRENNFVSLPTRISQLPELKQLSLFRCSNLESLPKTLPSKLSNVDARECPMLKNYSSHLTIRADNRFCHIDCGNPCENEENEDYWANHFRLPILEEHAETHFPKYIEERIKNEESFQLCYPHSAIIPDWCGEHSSRHSVTIQLSDSTWIGFALFVVFELLAKEDFNSWEMEDTFCHFSTPEGCLKNPLVLQTFSNFIKGSYGLCCYEPRGGRVAGQLNTESNLLTASVSTNRPDLKVKGCGVQLIYQKDAATFAHNLSESANGHLDMNFGQHCKGILDQAMKLKNSSEVTVLDCNVRELGSTSALNQGSSSHSTTYSNNEQSNEELELLLTALYEGCNGRDKNFHFIFRYPIISRWFFHHYAGDVALCHLPQDLYGDKRWVGLELYAVLTWSSSDSHNSLRTPLLHVDLCSHESRIIHRCIKIHSWRGRKQLVVLHIPRACFSQHELNQCQGVCALFRTSNPDVEVEVCGSRLVYEQDLEELIKALATECTFKEPLHLLYAQARTYVENMVESPLPEALTVQPDALLQSRDFWEVSKLFWQDLLLNAGPEEQVCKEDFNSRLHYYKCYLEQKQVLVEPRDHLLVHSKRYLLENRDSIQQHDAERYSESLDRRLYIMAESQPCGSCNIAAWKKSIVELLQIWEEAILSLKGHTISVLKLFDPSAPYNFCFPQKQILEWFKNQTSKSSKIGMELPQSLYDDDNWRGLVICAAFSVHELPTATLEKLGSEMTVELMCHLSTEKYCLNPIPICSTTKEKFKWLHLRGFIWLTYIPRNFLAEFKDITYVEARFYHRCPGLHVEDTGICLLYKHEVEELKQAMTQCWTSFFENSDLIRQFVEEDEIIQPSG